MKTVAIYLGGTPLDGGTYQYAHSLVSALADLPRDQYSTIGYCADPEWKRILAEQGIEAVRVRTQGPVSRLVTKIAREVPLSIALRKRVGSAVVPFGRQLESAGVDVCLYPNFEHFAWELATRSIATIHDLMHRYEPQFPEVSQGGIPARRDLISSRTRKGATAALVDSDVGRRQAIESYGARGSQLCVLPYVAPSYMYEGAVAHDSTEVIAWAAEKGVPDAYLFYPAQFWEHKNHVRLLDAFARLRAEHPDARLVLVGSEKNASAEVVERLAQDDLKTAVLVLGYVSNEQMVYLYKHARALVMPTFFGPTNIPPLEAFALGCPVAISGTYAMPEQAGGAALHFDPTSTDEIFDACKRLWEDDVLRAELAAKGRARAAQWGPRQFATRVHEIIDAVIEDRPCPEFRSG